MKPVNKEATLREVLAEVSIIDLASVIKSFFLTIGCYGVFIFVLLFLEGVTSGPNDGKSWFGIPDWAIYVFTAWIFIGSYTADKSYHEHRFSMYFPRAGFLWSIPIAAYLVLGFRALPSFDPAADVSLRLFNWLLWMAYFVPVVFALGVLEVGHRKLVEKRALELERQREALSEGYIGER